LKNRFFISHYLLIGAWLLGSVWNLGAQNAPVTTAGSVINALPGQSVTVPVTVSGFSNIGSVTLHLNYNYSKLHFVQCSLNPQLVSNFAVGDQNLGDGNHQVVIGWYSSLGGSLTNGSWLLNLTFSYISGSAPLEWYDNGSSCLYTDIYGNDLNDSPFSSYYINGIVCGTQGIPGSITGASAVCQGESGVTYSIVPLQNVTGYHWTVPSGASIISGNNTNGITVDFSTSAASGTVTVNGINECGAGPVSSLAVAVSVLPVANAGNDTAIYSGTTATLHAANGGSGNFSYHWSPENLLVNPNVQHPQTIQLTTTTLFHLLVTNQASGCANSDNVNVTITGGTLSVNPTVIPGTICRNSNAQLFANAGGGTGTYTYSWICTPPGNPAWTSNVANPVVSPDSSRHYMLTISDGFYSASGATNLVVDQLPTADISGSDSLCEDGSTTILRIDLTGIPPWTFTYTNGLTTHTITNQVTSPYLIVTSEPGVYSVLSVTDENCHGTTSGAAPVMVFPIPGAAVITQSGNTLHSNVSTGNQWYLDSHAIPGATSQTYIPVENGTYYDILTVNGCSSDSSNNLDVIVTYSEKIMSSAFQIYPNPAKDYFFLRSTAPLNKEMKLTFFSNDGIPIKECEINLGLKPNECVIDVRNLSPGFYFVMIYNGDKGVIQKLVIL
jgi:hypothetical protein